MMNILLHMVFLHKTVEKISQKELQRDLSLDDVVEQSVHFGYMVIREMCVTGLI